MEPEKDLHCQSSATHSACLSSCGVLPQTPPRNVRLSKIRQVDALLRVLVMVLGETLSFVHSDALLVTVRAWHAHLTLSFISSYTSRVYGQANIYLQEEHPPPHQLSV